MTGGEGYMLSAPGEVLAGREQRAALRQDMQARLGLPVVTVTLNIPGAVKDFALARRAADEAERLVRAALDARGWALAEQAAADGAAGPARLLAVRADAAALKRVALGVEATPGLGRLLDIDVADAQGHAVTRDSLGLAARRCFLCGGAARDCARARSHDSQPLFDFVLAGLREHFSEW